MQDIRQGAFGDSLEKGTDLGLVPIEKPLNRFGSERPDSRLSAQGGDPCVRKVVGGPGTPSTQAYPKQRPEQWTLEPAHIHLFTVKIQAKSSQVQTNLSASIGTYRLRLLYPYQKKSCY